MVNLKDSLKLISVMILTFGSIFICTIFFNYTLDLKGIEHLITDPQTQAVYDALTIQAQVVIAAAGGILGAVTFLVLLFSIRQFINENSAELGVLKALGYSENRISLDFSKFGLSVLAGSVLAFFAALFASPLFYNFFDSDGALPVKIVFNLHIVTPLILIAAPTVLFSVLSVLYARARLRKPPLALINGDGKTKISNLTKRMQGGDSRRPFIKELKRNMLWGNLSLIFFVGFAAFGFAAQIQMAFSMRQLSEGSLMTAVFITFGIILGSVTLLLALTFILNKNGKYLAMLKAYGYTENECGAAMFGGYRQVSYVGFAIGTAYQFFLVKMMASVFAGAYEIPELKFDWLGLAVTLAIFVTAYELLMLFYKQKISKIPLREIMQA